LFPHFSGCHVLAAAGRAIAFALAPGQAHELPMAPGLLGCLSDVPSWLVGDLACLTEEAA
jgi:hypothetical protein